MIIRVPQDVPTINIAMGLVRFGDTVIPEPGMYREALRGVIPAGVTLLSVTPLAVVLRPQGGVNVIRLNNPGIILNGIFCDASECTGAPIDGYNGGNPVPSVQILKCRAYGGHGEISSSSGIMGNFPDGLIDGCEVDHNTTGTNQDHGIYTAGPRCTIQNCYIHHNGAYGIVNYPDAVECITRWNRIEDNVLRGVLVRGTRNQFYENRVLRNGWTVEVGGDQNIVARNDIQFNGSGSYGTFISSGDANTVEDNRIVNNADNNVQDNGTNSIVRRNGNIPDPVPPVPGPDPIPPDPIPPDPIPPNPDPLPGVLHLLIDNVPKISGALSQPLIIRINTKSKQVTLTGKADGTTQGYSFLSFYVNAVKVATSTIGTGVVMRLGTARKNSTVTLKAE